MYQVKDVRFWKKSPSQGGLSRNEINEAALKLGINPKQFTRKDDLCDEIIQVLNSGMPVPMSPASPASPAVNNKRKQSPRPVIDGKAEQVGEMSNQYISQKILKVAEYYQKLGDTYRAKALNSSALLIEKFSEPIVDPYKQLGGVKGIGKGTLDRVSELLKHGTIAELQAEIPMDEKKVIVDNLVTVFGIGHANADRFVELGIKSIDDLREKAKSGFVKLISSQQFGLDYYDDLKQRVPRDEVKRVGELVIDAWTKMDSNNIAEIVGSYRRGNDTSGDIDILITNSEGKNTIGELVKSLQAAGLIERVLSLGRVKMMSSYLSNYPEPGGIMRKIDIRFVPVESWGSALLHSTGSDQFNVMLRKRAIERGLSLSEFGLFAGENKEERLPTVSEEDVFKALEMKYVPPNERNLVHSVPVPTDVS